jgi:hypothetical protein
MAFQSGSMREHHVGRDAVAVNGGNSRLTRG